MNSVLSQTPLKILLLDDQEIVKEGIKGLIRKAFPEANVSEASSFEETLNLVNTQRWDMVITELKFNGQDCLGLIRDISRISHDLPVVVCTSQVDVQYGLQSIIAGAWGYVQKTACGKQLVDAVAETLTGRRNISSELSKCLASYVRQGTPMAPQDKLSNRELQVFSRLKKKSSVKEMAEELALSVKTVSTYQKRILSKLDLKSQDDLVRYCRSHNIA